MSSASWNGSDMIYTKAIRPFVLRHQKRIDEAIDQAADKFKDGMYKKNAKGFLGFSRFHGNIGPII